MPEVFSDSFPYVSGEQLETQNPLWEKLAGATGSLQILNGRVRQGGSGTAFYFRSDSLASHADCEVSADIYISSAAAGPNFGITLRSSNVAQTFYTARLVSNTIQLGRFIAGSSVTLDSVAHTMVAGVTIRLKLRAQGNVLSVYVDDVLLISLTDTSITAAGYFGLRAINAAAAQLQLDNMVAATIAEEPTTYVLGASSDAQPNFGAAGAIAQSHSIGASASSATAAASSGSIVQIAALGGSASTSSASSSVGGIGQADGSITLAGAPSSQSAASGSATIVQAHALGGSAATQGASSGAGAVVQIATLLGASCAQGNSSTTGAVDGAAVLSGGPCSQSASSSPGAVVQIAALVASLTQQTALASPGAVVVVQPLGGSTCLQWNYAPNGALVADEDRPPTFGAILAAVAQRARRTANINDKVRRNNTSTARRRMN